MDEDQGRAQARKVLDFVERMRRMPLPGAADDAAARADVQAPGAPARLDDAGRKLLAKLPSRPATAAPPRRRS